MVEHVERHIKNPIMPTNFYCPNRGKNRDRKKAIVWIGTAAFLAISSSTGRAENMSGALALAYQENPDLNQQRAGLRAKDETVPQATAALRPQVSATGNYGYNYLEAGGSLSSLIGVPTTSSTSAASSTTRFTTTTGMAGLTVSQTLFNGNRNVNTVRQAESNVLGSRENLREVEYTVLLNAATAYMNVLRDTAVLDLRENNIVVLEEQLRQTSHRFRVGEETVTDVAQADASLASGRSDYFTAQANLATSIANYRQIIGVEPHRLDPARSIEALLPGTLQASVTIAFAEHPSVQAALHAVDSAELQVKIQEGQLYPTLAAVGSAQENYAELGLPGLKLFNGSAQAQLSAPIYTGGLVDAQVRQAKELLAQARIQADLQRDSVRALVVSTWGQLEATKASIKSNEAAVKAAEIALTGIRKEAMVGQRTTFDVLTAQQTLLNARVSLVTAQRDRVVASYAVMAAVGWLSAARLNLNVTQYDPTIHYDAVKDKWIGLRTPDGR
jgi:outer membrane protein